MTTSHLFLATILLLVGASVTSAQRPATISICDYYANALNLTQEQTINAVVVRAIVGKSDSTPAVTGLVNDPNTKSFFNGDIKYRVGSPLDGMPSQVAAGETPNYAGDQPTGVQGWLVDHLTEFFGAGLGCSGSDYPTYTNRGSMRDIHKNMPITKIVFSAFNMQVASSALSYGMTADDVSVVGGVLNSFNRNYNTDGTYSDNVICNDMTCDCASGDTNAQCNLVTTIPSGPGPAIPGNGATSSFSFSFALLAAMAISALALVARV